MAITLRLVKGTELSWEELDGNFTDLIDRINLKEDLQAELISGGETTVAGDTVTVAPAEWRVPPSNYIKVTNSVFPGIALSASGLQRYVAFYGDTNNQVIKVEGDEDAIAVLPDQPDDTALISYVLVGDTEIGPPVIDLTGYQLKSEKSSDIEADKASASQYPSVKALYDWATARFPSKTTISLTSGQMASYSGTQDGADITVTEGVITITNYDDLITKHGLCPTITATYDNQTGISKQGTFDDQASPTELVIDMGTTSATILTLK